MVDFKNGAYLKLKLQQGIYDKELEPILVNNEQIIASFKAMRDGVVFTNKRLITINVQGLSGAKKDYSSLPYSKIQAFSVETPGLMESMAWNGDSELEIWFSGLGRIKLEFHKDTDIRQICKIISTYTL